MAEADEEQSVDTGRILLHEYAKSGQADLLGALIGEGTAVDLANARQETALHWAARGGHSESIRKLVELGAAVNAQNNQGDSPLHLAAFKNHVEACRCLVQLGADRLLLNKEGKRPLDLARSVPVKVAVAPEEEECDGYSGSGSEEDF